MNALRWFSLLLSLLVPAASTLRAQQVDNGHNGPMAAAPQSVPGYLKDAGLEQRLNQPLPLSAIFVDETGRQAPLDAYFHKRPVAMALVYFKCGMLCPQVLHGMAEGLRQSGFKVGKDYDVVVESIDPMDTPQDAAIAKRDYLQTLGVSGSNDAAASVHFLTGQPASIAAISGATGFHYVKVPGPDGRMDQFAHSSVIMFATPEGRMSKYLAGITYEARDVRLALIDASSGKIGTLKDLVILYCCNYVPSAGKYTVNILRILSWAAMFSVVALITGVFLLIRKSPSAGSHA